MHPDAIIAIAASADSKALTKEVFGDEIGWLPWRRPGFELGLWLKRFAEENPQSEGRHPRGAWPVHLGRDAARVLSDDGRHDQPAPSRYLAERVRRRATFGGEQVAPSDAQTRRRIAAALMPRLRGLLSKTGRKIGHFDDQPAVLDFVNSNGLGALAPLGTSCPDHFLRTKIRPLVLDFDPSRETVDDLIPRG